MCATVTLKVPAAMRKVLEGGKDGRQTKGRTSLLQATLCSFLSPPLLFGEPWLQAGACAFSDLRMHTGPEASPTEQ